jgi:Family of unknown function (DUF5675)
MIEIIRVQQSNKSTLSHLVFDGKFEHFLLEDAIRKFKIHGETCIPEGEYTIGFNTEGQMNKKYKSAYPKIHRGMIEIKGIPDYSFVYAHIGNKIKDTLGCVLTGESFTKDTDENFMVLSSRIAYERSYLKFCDFIDKGKVKIIVRNAPNIIPLDATAKI